MEHQAPMSHGVVRVHIDQKPHESPNPTSAVDLCELALIPESRVLYREVKVDREDELIPIDRR